ncbi:SagB/ThcOx family dehydrogenase [Brevibacillus antibioticus]|uniref:SagB/ThcOx family dehydrogenase n=1 Tax=Brevibacillus antibioticus TaxID=2570228 RepID=A0A4V5TJV3_9BACL|nr:SagB/ThcOx family dehydrogenase [Brevibacillus antibioticus]TKI55483.1 SagB/ThcOx family dehydrogenase [Brevibacillus antibioticus]
MQQQVAKKMMKPFYEDCDYFWSPSVRWEQQGEEICIESLSYSGTVLALFPTFYYLTQKGIKIPDLISSFPQVNPNHVADFVRDLITNRILVHSLLTPQEIYYPQEHLIFHPYSPETFLDPAKYEAFRQEKLSRSFPQTSQTNVPLAESVFPEVITNRRTCRHFEEKKKVSFDTFSSLISVFKQYRCENEIHYYYASAGGLYPIDLYIYIKDHRVENVKAGLYYFNPIENILQMVSNTCVITEDAHYSMNKEIFQSSAFSIYLIYNAEVTMPKYGGMGYFYAGIDSGIMVQLLTHVAGMHQVGVCSIGDINFRRIQKYFKLSPRQVLIHSIEVGLQPQ